MARITFYDLLIYETHPDKWSWYISTAQQRQGQWADNTESESEYESVADAKLNVLSFLQPYGKKHKIGRVSIMSLSNKIRDIIQQLDE